jgi:hypothetical protein
MYFIEFAVNRMKTELQEILAELRHSLENGTVVSIRTFQQNKPLLTVVEQLQDNACVVIRSASLYGHAIANTHIRVSDIRGVVRFRAHYEDPLFVRLREIRNTIHTIRGGMKNRHSFNKHSGA